jgi:hypothetical protein
MYRMPTHFGPSTGPRHGTRGERFLHDRRRSLTIRASFLTDAAALDKLTPAEFALWGEPVVTLHASYMTEIPWLAGRGYNVLGFEWPVRFAGKIDTVEGEFLSVLWENLAEPILTGREELGFAKIFCDLPEPRRLGSTLEFGASWQGFRFLDVRVTGLSPIAAEDAKRRSARRGQGLLHLKYMPTTGEWGKADVCYPTFSPADDPDGFAPTQVLGAHTGEASIRFTPARWEDLPTQYMIVNALAGLPQIEMRGAIVLETIGGSDLSHQRRLG